MIISVLEELIKNAIFEVVANLKMYEHNMKFQLLHFLEGWCCIASNGISYPPTKNVHIYLVNTNKVNSISSKEGFKQKIFVKDIKKKYLTWILSLCNS